MYIYKIYIDIYICALAVLDFKLEQALFILINLKENLLKSVH